MSKRNVYDCYKKYKVPQRASISKQVACEEKVYTPEFAEVEVVQPPPQPETVVPAEGQTVEDVQDAAIEAGETVEDVQNAANEAQTTPLVPTKTVITKTVIDLKFECLKGKGEDISDYCYQKVLYDAWTHAQYIECSMREDIKLFKEGDAFV